MKKIIITAIICFSAFWSAMAQSPMTPRAAMANCAMVDPEDHIANDYNTPEAFIKRNSTLNEQVMMWANEQMKNIDMNFNPIKAQKESDRKRDQQMKRVQKMQNVNPQQHIAALQRMLEDMKSHYKMSDKDMEKVMEMSDSKAEAFFRKRAEELGVEYIEPDPSNYGAVMLERDEEAEALAEKRAQVQKRTAELEKVVQTFFDRQKVVNNILESLQKTAAEKCEVERKKWYKRYEAIPTAAGPGGIKNPKDVERLRREAARALILFEQQVWIAPAREQLIGLLADAEAADEANAECLRLWLSVTDDAMARQGLMQKYNHTGMRYAVAVYGLYDNATTEYCKFIPKRGWDH